MDSLLFAINAIAPIVLMVLIGYLLKKIKLIDSNFTKTTNKLVFNVFMPVMLFLNIYNINDLSTQDFKYMWYIIGFVILVFLIGIPLVILTTPKNERRGVLAQATFRSSYSLIGIPLAEALNGALGVACATLLAAIVIPLFNILAIISFTIFNPNGEKPSIKKIIIGIIKNPLILGILAGLIMAFIRSILADNGINFKLENISPLYTILGYLSKVTIPLALLVLGAQFEFSVVSSMKKEIVFGTLARTIIVPLITIGLAFILFKDKFLPAHFACIVATFATPITVAIVPMAQEMKSDEILAGQLVVWTTLISGITVFLATFLLNLGGAI